MGGLASACGVCVTWGDGLNRKNKLEGNVVQAADLPQPGLREDSHHIFAVGGKFVIDGPRAGKVEITARCGNLPAVQRDVIAVVAVESLMKNKTQSENS